MVICKIVQLAEVQVKNLTTYYDNVHAVKGN